MSDLISRSELIKDIKDWQEDIHYNEKDAIKHDFVFDRIYEMLYEQPTAYDIDKIVEELKKASYRIDDSATLSTRDVIDIEDAIEIVKRGGLRKDVE